MKKFKRLTAMVLAVVLVSAMGTTVIAENNKVTHEIVIDDSALEEFSPQANMDSIQRGDMLRKARYDWTISGITQYYQNGGDTWDDDKMETCNLSIKSAGCCLTSFAMAISQMGYNEDPGVANRRLGTAACPFIPSLVKDRYNSEIAQGKSLTSGTQSQFLSFIVDQISWDVPVIVGCRPKSGTGITDDHFVLAYGYSGDTVYIYDPAYQNDYTELSSYLTNYNVYRAYCFSYVAR